MTPERAYTLDAIAVAVVGVTAIIAIASIVLELNPAALEKENALTGNAVNWASSRPVTAEYDWAWLDFNGDGILDHYDYQDVLAGRVECDGCDLNGDGRVDGLDAEAFDLTVTMLYDYDRDAELTRKDARVLAAVMQGNAPFDTERVYDLTGDGRLSNEDVARFTALIYNYDKA